MLTVSESTARVSLRRTRLLDKLAGELCFQYNANKTVIIRSLPLRLPVSLAEIPQSTDRAVACGMSPARFSVAQFDAIIDAGIFPANVDRRIQLLRGEIVYMTPPNPPHDDVVSLAVAWAVAMLDKTSGAFEVRCQSSMDLRQLDSVVLPDIAFVRSQSYARRRPTALDARLVIEVSDSSLAYDLGEKLQLYAEAGVAEYWVIDIPHRLVIVHLHPMLDRYGSVQTFEENQLVESKLLPGVSLVPISLFRK